MSEEAPLISVVVPVWRPLPEFFRRMLSSVHHQSFDSFEVSLCDDASDDPSTANIVAFACGSDKIRVVNHPVSRGMVAAAKTAYREARGEFVTFLSQNDQLLPDALRWVAEAIQESETVDVLYTDEDKSDLSGTIFDEQRKADWSPELLLSAPYLGHLLVIRRSLLDEVGGLGDR